MDFQVEEGGDEGRKGMKRDKFWKNQTTALCRCGNKKYKYKSGLRACSSWLQAGITFP